MIEVTYDGAYPNACAGRLLIKQDGEVIYDERHCCHSTGGVWFDKDGDEHVESGELVWNDRDQHSAEIGEAVYALLCGVRVCCGGCI